MSFAQKSNRLDGIAATTILGIAIIISGLSLANASTDAEPKTQASIVNVTTSGNAGQTITVKGTAGMNL